MVQLSNLDARLMGELMQDSRTPVARLAKGLGVSREVATYRINRLKQKGIILGFVTEINYEKLGFAGAAVFINVKAHKQDEFRAFLQSCDFVSWVVEFSGLWSFAFSILGRTNKELDEKFRGIYKKFKDDIIDHRFTHHRRNTFFYEKYFGIAPEQKRGKKNDYEADKKDKEILKELAQDSRKDCVSLGQKVGLTPPAISQRIRLLERGGYIEKFSLFADISKLGLYHYSIFIINKDLNEQTRFISHLSKHPKVSYVAEYIGDPFIEFGLFTSDPYELRAILRGIEEMFPNNRVIEVSLFQKDIVSVRPPACVFE